MAINPRDLIIVERPDKTRTAGGGTEINWVEHCREWAEIERMQSFRFDVERVTAGGLGSTPIVRVHVHDNARTRTITNEMRISDQTTGRTLNVTTPPQDLRNDGLYLTILCTEELPT